VCTKRIRDTMAVLEAEKDWLDHAVLLDWMLENWRFIRRKVREIVNEKS
jgi:hypothetical protein